MARNQKSAFAAELALLDGINRYVASMRARGFDEETTWANLDSFVASVKDMRRSVAQSLALTLPANESAPHINADTGMTDAEERAAGVPPPYVPTSSARHAITASALRQLDTPSR